MNNIYRYLTKSYPTTKARVGRCLKEMERKLGGPFAINVPNEFEILRLEIAASRY